MGLFGSCVIVGIGLFVGMRGKELCEEEVVGGVDLDVVEVGFGEDEGGVGVFGDEGLDFGDGYFLGVGEEEGVGYFWEEVGV